jgi:galactokinase
MLDSGFRMLDTFRELFGPAEAVRTYRAPGRVNLIGEHTDYNLGFVLPVALDLATTVMMAPSHDGMLRIYSQQRQEMREWKADEVAGLAPAHEWSDYPIGVARELILAGFPIQPSNLLISSTVPEGSGLSSSAALEVSSALALLHGRTLNSMALALLCQRAERNFVGMPCGIMDQYISVFGKQNSAVEIDCRSLGHRLVPLPAGITFVAVNSMVKHALASSAYRERVAECAAAVAGIHDRFPGVESLRDATVEQLEAVAPQLPEVVVRRARHVVTEDDRVGRFVQAAEAGDPFRMGRLMLESHASLRDDYQVSCEELDFLVDAARDIDDVYGSRMTGGGFGGCTVTLMDAAAAPAFGAQIADAYRDRYGVTPAVYACRPSDGAREV